MMKLDLKPGEYVLWSCREPQDETFVALLAGGIVTLFVFGLRLIFFGIVTLFLFGLGLILIIGAVLYHLYSSEYVLTNMSALQVSRRGVNGEVALNTPGLTVELVKLYNEWKWEEKGHWCCGEYVVEKSGWVRDHTPTGKYDVNFVVENGRGLKFEDLSAESAHGVAAMLASMGIKVVEYS